MFKRKTAAIGAAATLLVGFTGYGIAQAAIPNSVTGEFTACVANYTGTVKIIDKEAGATCGYGYVEKTWNQAGQPGPQGVPGPQGPQGEPGASATVSTVVLEGFIPPNTPTAEHWLSCPDGGTILSVAGEYSVQNPGQWEWVPPYWTGSGLFPVEYTDNAARVSYGNDRMPDAEPAPYKFTLKCQGV